MATGFMIPRSSSGGDPMTIEERIAQLETEVVAQRLITRALLGHMLANSRKPIGDVVRDLEEAAEKASPDLLPLPDVDLALQQAACQVAKKRMTAILGNLGALAARPR